MYNTYVCTECNTLVENSTLCPECYEMPVELTAAEQHDIIVKEAGELVHEARDAWWFREHDNFVNAMSKLKRLVDEHVDTVPKLKDALPVLANARKAYASPSSRLNQASVA